VIISLGDNSQRFVVGIRDLRAVVEPYLDGLMWAVMVVTASNHPQFLCSKILLRIRPHLVSLDCKNKEKKQMKMSKSSNFCSVHSFIQIILPNLESANTMQNLQFFI
jgi:hypothetical protein